MNWFDLALFSVKSMLLAHAVPLGLIAVVTVVALSVVFFGTGPMVLAFLRSRVGQVLIALVVAGILGWELKGYVDDSVTLRRQLAAERRESDRALADERMRTKAALQRAADARRQADDQRAIAGAAANRETAARTEADALQEQVDDLNDTIAARPEPRCALSADDARRLRAIGAGARKPR